MPTVGISVMISAERQKEKKMPGSIISVVELCAARGGGLEGWNWVAEEKLRIQDALELLRRVERSSCDVAQSCIVCELVRLG
jgi:hypothetical protein